MIFKLTLDLPEDGAYVRLTRHLGVCLLEDLKVSHEEVSDIEFVIGEICSNVTRHAQSGQGRYLVMLELYADRLVVTVQDTGKGFSFRDVPEPGSSRPDFDGGERLGGFGLPMVELLTDRLEFYRTDPQGATVRAEKVLHYETQAAAAGAARMDASQGGEASISAG